MKKHFFRPVVWYLIVAMLFIGLVPRVEAGLSPSDVVNPTLERTQDLAKVQKAIESKMIRERLEKLGYSTAEVTARFERLSDQQLHQLAQNLDDVKVAGDDGLGIIIVLLVIAILVVVLLQLTGHKVIVR